MSQPLFASLFDETERRPLTVSELTGSIRKAIEARFASIWVEGEISNFKAHSSGHWYFTIKDEGAQLRAKCFRSANSRIRFRPTDGLHVRARGRLTVYEARGEYELIVEALDPVGAGALQVAFEQLRDRLQAEGLFARELKRPLPVFPGRVGVVTSPTGAAIRDILNVIARRTRTVHVLFSPARVQGEGAGSDIARAIKLINEHHERARRDERSKDFVDVLIVGRGGGSTEDLWAFNEEEVARAIRASAIPVISAVGHETDFTIADFVADKRAATPSAAAELVAAREDQICATLAQMGQNLSRLMRYKIVTARTRVQQQALSHAFGEVRGKLRDAGASTSAAQHRLHILMAQALRTAHTRADPLGRSLAPAQLRARLAEARVRFDSAYSDCNAALAKQMEEAEKRLGLAAASLDALSPLAVLQRGYAIAQRDDGRLLRDAKSISVGDSIRVRLAKGRFGARVEDVEEM
ncbi:MAG TPA: exodeoxyribonuclease VII large subunit [Blastocatellia bacterium]|jgi:exodeoxyribonuclease VII large subunit|nr:exodeoxyribonuclease VII large subunit [Blastocatellia bacterium]HAF22095.1 exodeoxyribonuclease VII large subunit [Blastocatellia bacterium]